MNETIIFRNKKPDISKYYVLFNSTGWNDIYHATKRELKVSLGKSWFCVSAYDKNKLAGFGRILSDGYLYSIICDMIVDKAYRNRGIGTSILDRLINHCRKNKIKAIWLFAAKGKRSFYEKRGFISRPEEGPGMYYGIL